MPTFPWTDHDTLDVQSDLRQTLAPAVRARAGVNLLVFMLVSVANHHFGCDLRIRALDVKPLALLHDVTEHLHLRFHDPTSPGSCNVLQKLAYAAALFVLLPTMVLSGLTMSPGMDAALPWPIALFDGRSSARSTHFVTCWLFVGFVAVHLLMVLLAGPIAEVSSMLTGWWRVPKDEAQPTSSRGVGLWAG